MNIIEKKAAALEEQARKKERLERLLLPKIRARYRDVIRSFEDVFPSSGHAPDVSTISFETKADLESHYAVVHRNFRDQVGSDLDVSIDGDAHSLGQAAFAAWVAARAVFNATRIVRTAANRISRSIALASEELIRETGEVPRRDRAMLVGIRAARPILARHAGQVARIETQAAAEATKSQFAEVLAGMVPRDLRFNPRAPRPRDAAIPAKKTWLTELDERVRRRHAATEGQTVGALEFFNVGGQNLLFPGDTDNGADLANIINCRCTAFYERV